MSAFDSFTRCLSGSSHVLNTLLLSPQTLMSTIWKQSISSGQCCRCVFFFCGLGTLTVYVSKMKSGQVMRSNVSKKNFGVLFNGI